MNTKKLCLNLGAGIPTPSRYSMHDATIHVDSYYNTGSSLSLYELENTIDEDQNISTPLQYRCKSDIFEFVEGFSHTVNKIYAERIFEHMSYLDGSIGRLLEGINRISNPGVELIIVVPNAKLIAEMLLDYEKNASNYSIANQLNQKLIINSENHNIVQDPHLSTWSPRLATEYIESEGTWTIDKLDPQITFAGRDIYMRITCINNKVPYNE